MMLRLEEPVTHRGLALILLASVVGLGLAFVSQTPAADTARGVVVDPMEFRQPVPDPWLGLTHKYDGKRVRFSGVARRFSVDKRTRNVAYEVQYDILQPVPTTPSAKTPPGRKPVLKVAETIVVAVSFRSEPKNLQKDIKGSKTGVPLTVEGTGHVQTNGTLTITDAVVVSGRPFSDR
jgi:hypothetical protein